MNTENKTIVHFHTGRGGRFNNAGHVTFAGVRDLSEVLTLRDSGKHWSFLHKENGYKVSKMLSERNLTNLLQMFERCQDANDFTLFEKKTGIDLGEDVYFDSNGDEIITAAEVAQGVGCISWDFDYDTDTCTYLADCSESELKLIADADTDLIEEYFNECTDLQVDWSKFNGEYTQLITDYMNHNVIELEYFYELEEKI